MRKFYSIFAVALVALVSFAAKADKTITFKIDTPEAVTYADPVTYNYVTPTDTEWTMTVADYAGFQFYASSGYKILKLVAQSGSVFDATGNNWDYVYFSAYPCVDGDVVTIVTANAADYVKKAIIKANPEQIYVNHNYQDYEIPASGELELAYDQYNNIYINAKDGYGLVSVKTGDKVWPDNGKQCSIYPGELTELVTEITVESIDENLLERPHFTVSVKGDAYKAQMQNASDYTYVDLSNEPTQVIYREGTSYYISPNGYNNTVTQVLVNDEPLAPTYNMNWTYTPAANDVVVIDTTYPDVDVPVTFSFSDQADASIIARFSVDNEAVDATVWNAEGYTVKLGSKIGLTFNNENFSDINATVNSDQIYSTDYEYTFNATEESGYTIAVSGKRSVPYNVEIAAEDLTQIIAYKGYTQDTYDLGTGTSTTIAVSRSNPSVKIVGAEGYLVTAIYVDGTPVEYITNAVYIEKDCSIEVETKPIVRDMTAVVWQQAAAWSYKSFVLAPQDYSLRKDVDLADGYNFIYFGTFDTPFSIGHYPNPTVYLDDEVIDNVYGTYPALENYTEGQVIKLFYETPTAHEITYDIAENAAVTVRHDHVRNIENPSTHNVFAGTQVHICPVNTLADNAVQTVVKVNDETVNPDEDGNYAFIVNGPTAVTVTQTSGIENVTVNSGDEATEYFDIHGRRIARPVKGNVYVRRSGSTTTKVIL